MMQLVPLVHTILQLAAIAVPCRRRRSKEEVDDKAISPVSRCNSETDSTEPGDSSGNDVSDSLDQLAETSASDAESSVVPRSEASSGGGDTENSEDEASVRHSSGIFAGASLQGGRMASSKIRLGLDCTACPTQDQETVASSCDLFPDHCSVKCGQEQAFGPFGHSGWPAPAGAYQQHQPHPLLSPIRQLINALEDWEASTGAEDYFGTNQAARGASTSVGNPTLDLLGGAVAKLAPQEAAMVKNYLDDRLNEHEVPNNFQLCSATQSARQPTVMRKRTSKARSTQNGRPCPPGGSGEGPFDQLRVQGMPPQPFKIR